MKYVKVRPTRGGYSLDPTGYLDQLPELAPRLPPGAARFAADPDHYDFLGERCVKDLKLVSMGVAPGDERLSVTARFEWNEIAPVGLTVRYRRVTDLEIATKSVGPVQLDEILPHDRGCRHEIRLIGGWIAVVCGDLDAVWEPRPG